MDKLGAVLVSQKQLLRVCENTNFDTYQDMRLNGVQGTSYRPSAGLRKLTA